MGKLTKERIAELRGQLAKAEPYTEKELDDIGFDGKTDPDRVQAYLAKRILTREKISLDE